MKAEDMLKMIGEAREDYVLVAEESRNGNIESRKRLSSGYILLIAAVFALSLLLMGSAVISMRLQNLTIGKQPGNEGGIKPAATDTSNSAADAKDNHSDIVPATEATVPPETGMNGEEINLISLQGYMGSDSYAAFNEWREFLDAYDPDKSILYANNHTFQCPEAYSSYHCYSQDMVDKVDEICEKYNLQPLGKYWYLTRGQDVLDAVGIENVFSESEDIGFTDILGYCFRDGTFSLEGRLELTGKWSSLISFGYRCVQKTSFDGVAMNIGDVDQYDQWNYTTQDGTEVLLALRDEAAIMIVDREDSFVTVSIWSEFADGQDCTMPAEREYLETLCEAFDFTYQTKPVDAALADALYQAQLEREERGETDREKYQVDYGYPDTYAGVIDFMVNELKYTGLKYALIDIDGNGVDEMLLQCVNLVSYDGNEDSFFSIYTITDGKANYILNSKKSCMYLCQDGVFEHCYQGGGHEYTRLLDGMEYIDYVGYYEQDGVWRTIVFEGENGSYVAITEEEAKTIIAKYPRVDIDFRPVSEFPRQ